MKLYVVTQGQYSDYHIEGIYDTKRSAEKVVRIMGKKDSYSCSMRTEEWELNIGKPKFYRHICYIKKDTGKITKLGRSAYISLENDAGFDWRTNSYYAMGETEEEAKKNAIDFRTQELAREKGVR